MTTRIITLFLVLIITPLNSSAQDKTLPPFVKKRIVEYRQKFQKTCNFKNKNKKNTKRNTAKDALKSYFYHWPNKKSIYLDFVNLLEIAKPDIAKAPEYFNKLFRKHEALQIKFDDEILFDYPLKLNKQNFSSTSGSKEHVFKKGENPYLKEGGFIDRMDAAEKQGLVFVRTGFKRNIKRTPNKREAFSSNDMVYLFWVYHESRPDIPPQIVLSSYTTDKKEFDSSFNISPENIDPPPPPEVKIEDEVANKVKALYQTLNAPKVESLEKIVNQYFVSGEVFVASTLSLEGEKSDLRAMGYVGENLRLKPKHKLDILDVEETPKGEYKVEATLTTTIINEADTITNKAPISIFVETKKENDKLSSILISGITSGDIEHNKKSPKVTPPPLVIAPPSNPTSAKLKS